MASDKKFIIILIVVGIASLVVMVGVIGQGNVREIPLFYPEKVEQTVAFQEVDGKVMLVGKIGVLEGNNPTLIMRTSFAYILTVINEGTTNHRLYIDGLEVQTDLLNPGENDTITIIPNKEGVYNYYDKRERNVLLGQIKAVTVVPSDEFEGIMRDLI
ncbi:MAG: hypothetical protein ACE5RN_00260 [Nitrosopumilaceae archaeon]